MAYDLGDSVPLSVVTRDAVGNPADATSNVVTVTLPDETTVTPLVLNPQTGHYQVNYTTVQAGWHKVRWAATGAIISAYADGFEARLANPFTILSLADAKRKCKIHVDDNTHDEALRDYVEASTMVIERHRHQIIARRSITEYHDVSSTRRLVLQNHPAISLTTVERVDGSATWNTADLHLDPSTGMVTVLQGPSLSGHIRFVLLGGLVVVPRNITLAAGIITEHLWMTERAQTVSGARSGYEDSMDIRGLMGFAIPNRALELLGKPPPLVA